MNWKTRKDIAQGYWNTIDHPHRKQIVSALNFKWDSLLEIGCCSGTNLQAIKENTYDWYDKMVCGIDINKEAIEFARKKLPEVAFIEADIEDLKLDGLRFDAILIDAVLLYVDDKKIKGVLEKISKCAKKRIIMCEWYSEEETKKDDHWARNYPKLLNKWRCLMKPINWPEKMWKKNGRIFIFHHLYQTGKIE